METVFGLMLIWIAVSHGTVTSCDGRQDGAQCYVTLRRSVDIRIMDNAAVIYSFWWKYSDTVMFYWRKDKVVTDKEGKYFFIPENGTFRINNLSRSDSGQHKLEIFDSEGKMKGRKSLEMSVQAPVSSVQLVPQCLSQGQMEVSCSSEGGDSPQYSWTLDGHTLTDSELLSVNNETNIIVLRQTVSGRLICSVRNHVSNLSNSTQISTCGPSSLFICGIRFAVIILLLILICLYFTWKKKKTEKLKTVGSQVIGEQENSAL